MPFTASTVPRQTLGWLVSAALDELFYQQQNEEDEDFRSCCPFCEAQCAALLDLYMSGPLGDVVPAHERHDANAGWSVEDGTVSYEFLDASWGWRMSCCDGNPTAPMAVREPGYWVRRYNEEFVARMTGRTGAEGQS